MYSLMRQSKRLGYLIDIEYVGKRGRAMLKFFDPIQQELFVWYDNTGHLSYLITDAPGEKIEKLLSRDEEYRGWIDIERYDAVLDETVTLRKVFAETPLAIGGQRRFSRARNFRSVLETGGCNVWEAWIRYQNGYCYDLGLEMGMPYIVTERDLSPFFDEKAGEKMKKVISKLRDSGVEITDMIRHWVRLFETSLPRPNILALDIEVLPERPETMPNAFMAGQEVTAVGLVGTNGLNRVLVLERDGIPMGELKENIEVIFFDSERNLLLEVFRIMREYPFVVTFNGDNFDLMYLYNRAKRFNISPSYNPIYIVNKICKITNAVHIDLYTFLKIPSIQGYAFSGKYKDFGLDDICKGLLGEGKAEFDEFIGDLPLYKLAEYCHTDARITLKLMTFNDHTTTDLILMLMRMSNLSPYQVTRSRIGEWIKSTFFSLLRRNKTLIPNQQQLQSKGQIQTTSLIKGKKYQGAIVWEPIPGIFFKVVVVDFASLYPTEVKERNIGYGSINCDHPECMSNIVPDTTHHICIKNRALEADVIGGLRDVRVFIYKPLGKTNSYYYTLQQAIKVYLNASYGVFGNESYSMYCPPVAEAITAYSRRDMIAVVNKSKEMNIVVLGGDSVTGDTLVTYKKNNKIYMCPIEYMYQKEDADSMFTIGKRNDGKIELVNNGTGHVEMLSMDKNGNISWGKVKRLIKHKTNKPIFKITTKYGIVKTTPDNSLMEYLNGEFKEIKPYDITNNTLLVHALNLPEYEGENIVDLSEWINNIIVEDEKIYVRSPTGCKRSVIKKSRIGFKRRWTGNELKKFCWNLGMFVADGSSTDKGRKLSRVSNQNIEFINRVSNFQLLSTGRKTKIIPDLDKRTGNTMYHCSLSSVVEYEIFSQLCGSGSFHKRVPLFIYSLERQYQQEFINGFWAGDDTKEPKYCYDYELTTSSIELTNGLLYLLRRIGSIPRIESRKDKISYRIRSKKSIFSNSEIINDVVVTPVKFVEIDISEDEQYVYDVEILPNHTFVGGGMFVLHNTDSVFLHEPTVEETRKLQEWTRKELSLDLGVDKVYRYAIFSKRKKNYLGIFENGTADMKGLTGKKRHIPIIIKDRFSLVVKLLGSVYNMDDYKKAKQQILDNIMGLQLTINNRSWDKNEDLAFHVRLGKNVDQYDTNPQHVKIAKMLIAEGYPVKGGDSMSFLKSTTEEGVMPTKIAKRELVNVDKYLKQVQSVFEQIVEPMELDITVERMGEGKLVRPTSLSYFMIPKTLST